MPERILTSAQAINEALAIMGERDKNVLLFGEGIDDKGAFYGTTFGLKPIYGNRLIEMPVSENGMMGVAIGAAMSGKRPVISFHRVEFALLAMEQIINNAAKMHYLSNGKHICPLVIRMIIGRGWGNGPEHTQSLESMFAYIPGLKVIMPTFPEDYKGMMISAIEDNNPVVVLEHRWTHYVKGNVSERYYKGDITKPKKKKTGNSCTIVANTTALLYKLGIKDDTDVFDLNVLRPLNLEEIMDSLRKTGHLVMIDTGYKTCGVGAEIIAQCVEAGLQFTVQRIGIPDHPIPSSRGYLEGLYPDTPSVIDSPDPAFQGPF
jgi:acetoin:2,6-dichlorophenolindophenol oxidoreductase subunit beta